MSELRSVIEGLRAESLAELPDARIEEEFAELQRCLQALEVERLRRLAEIDRRGVFARDGYLSCVAWLGARCDLAWGEASGGVRTARALQAMPETMRALAKGEVSLPAARLLVRAREADPAAFAAGEAVLVAAARVHRTGDLGRVLVRWRRLVQAERLERGGTDELRARRRLHASVLLDGVVRVDADLDPETGQALLSALGAVTGAEARSAAEDERTPAQRRADALGEICRQWLDRGDRPAVAGERPHVAVVVGLDDLRGGEGRPAHAHTGRPAHDLLGHPGVTGEWDQTGPLAEGAARRLSCDAAITRVVMAGASVPLDVGRRTPVVPPAIRRAVIVRDRHCRFPGCDRPRAWCDAHHVRHWADGGATSLQNLLLLCRRHHWLVHERAGFGLELAQGRPVFRRPDGSILEDRGPP